MYIPASFRWWLVVWWLVALAWSAIDPARMAAQRTDDKAFLIELEGPITPMQQQFVLRSLERARRQEATVVILQIESPGGYLHTSLELAETFREIDWARTVAYVPVEAISGGAIVALGCQEIVLHPTARFGDAGPIFAGQDAQFRHAPEKVRSYLAVRMRELAEAQGRPPALAEAMVDTEMKVYRVPGADGAPDEYISERELAAAPAREPPPLPVPETGDGRFLTLNGIRTVELSLAEATVDDRNGLRRYLGIDGEIRLLRRTAVDSVVFVLNHPLVTGLLFVIGLVALYIELTAPGISIGGITAGLCFALFFWSCMLGGTAGWLEVILFLGGLAFLAIEFFVIPGFGVAGLSGILLLVASMVLASQSFIIPETGRQLEEFSVTLMVAVGSGLAFLASAALVSRHFGRIPVLNRLALAPPVIAPETPTAKPVVEDHRFPVGVGALGQSDTPLRPAGRAVFNDDYVDVVTDGSFVDAGRSVRVIQISGNRVVVRAVDHQT